MSGTTFTMGSSDTTLTAKWTANTYKIAYDGNGATSGSTQESTHTYDVDAPLTNNGYERSYNVIFNHNYSESENEPRTAKYTFANWTFNGNNYGNGATVKNLATGGTITMVANWNSASVNYLPVRPGYTFEGWFADAEGTGNRVDSNGVYTPTADITLYAKWTINNYILTINPNGGTFEGKEDTVTQDMVILNTRALPNPTKTGWIFNGWSVNGGENCSINNNIFTMGSSDTNLVAQWTKIDSSAWDNSKVSSYTDFTGGTAPIPTGYVASKATGENIVGSGLVIYEGLEEVNDSNVENSQKARNQWVWVPVPDPSRIYEESDGKLKSKLYTYTNTGRNAYKNDGYEPGILAVENESSFSKYELHRLTREKFAQELQIEFNKTIHSIENYGGFYIGRYETGNLSQKIPVLRKMNTDISDITWYNAYNKFEYLGVNSKVKTNIIWGNLYDETLQWLVDTGSKTASQIGVDSSTWGNYANSALSYTNASGGNANKDSGTEAIIPAGSSDSTKANNIYDLAGNVWDGTLEGDNTYRKSRGGCYSETNITSGTRGITSPGTTEDAYGKSVVRGYRAYLYIK